MQFRKLFGCMGQKEIDPLPPSLTPIEAWLADPSATGQKEEAALRIRLCKGNLNMYELQLNKLPFVLRELNLTALDLSSNKLTSFPELGQLTNLTSLELCCNSFTLIPTEIGRLTKLTKLYMSCIGLSSLPKEIGQLTSLSELNLTRNQLTTLPTEIGKLTSLTVLFLSGNNITSFPTEIARLTKLTMLRLWENKLTSLPVEIAGLTELKILKLWGNNLKSLPPEIGRLTKLTELDVYNNILETLPAEIGQLTNLEVLDLSTNCITLLPLEIGNLSNMTKLRLDHNPNLRELPLSLGQIPGLTEIFTAYTRISSTIHQAILNQCRMMRDDEAAKVLPERFSKWTAVAKSRLELKALSDDQKKTLNEWLLRLEKTKDFAKQQSSLARTVCSILEDVFKTLEFAELFFSQAEANNACCEDRAAMALNEIYTSWMILCKSVDLKMLTGVAKTLTLRKELQKLIKKEERESVEIFLYYETMLKKPLGLVTAIEHMSYATIGSRSWIDEEALVKKVNESFFSELLTLPAFEKLVKTELKEEWDRIALNAQNALTERPVGDDLSAAVLNWSHKQGKIMQEMKHAWAKCVKQWYEANDVS